MRISILVLLLSPWILSGCRSEPVSSLTIAAASSLRTVLPALIDAAPIEDTSIHATYAASGVLRQEVEAGAPVDLMIFAAGAPIDRLIHDGYAEKSSRRVIATNALVLVVPKGAGRITFEALAGLLPKTRIAVGDPRTVPAGHYAQRALSRLGVWDKLNSNLVYGANVAAVLAYARRGEVDAAIVYATDAATTSDVTVTDRATGSWAPHPIIAAALRTGAPEAAHSFLDFLLSDRGQAILRAHGFGAAPHDAGS